MGQIQVVDAGEDGDEDGLSNLQEFDAGTDPRNSDSDEDGLSDGEENLLIIPIHCWQIVMGMDMRMEKRWSIRAHPMIPIRYLLMR